MSEILDRALETLQKLPPAEQDEIAHAVLALAGREEEPEPINPSDLSAVLEGMAQIKRGERATLQQVEAAYRRFET